MKKDGWLRIISALMIVVLFSGCTTMMRVNAVDPNGEQIYDARVLIDGEYIGETPEATAIVSNFIAESPEIRVTKDGYNSRSIEPNKEIKIPALIAGVFVWVPLLWVWGPKAQQTVVLTPSTR
jgi:hypothetical protein